MILNCYYLWILSIIIYTFILKMYFIFRGTDFFFRKISSLIIEIFPKEEQVSIQIKIFS